MISFRDRGRLEHDSLAIPQPNPVEADTLGMKLPRFRQRVPADFDSLSCLRANQITARRKEGQSQDQLERGPASKSRRAVIHCDRWRKRCDGCDAARVTTLIHGCGM